MTDDYTILDKFTNYIINFDINQFIVEFYDIEKPELYQLQYLLEKINLMLANPCCEKI
jgi:hypothetical protein